MSSDIQIAQSAELKPILELAKSLNIEEKYIEQYGKYKAKINTSLLNKYRNKSDGKLILVTAINPTAAGEGKTTVSIGLTQALCKLGKKAIAALREPSLGPVFGMKGGATGGGYSQVVPMEDINLHFTGDIHAVTSAHNLISAAIDNHLWYGNNLNIDLENITWKRSLDMNDRSLRYISMYSDSKYKNPIRDSSFQITAASEIMAILCLSNSLEELRDKVDNIIFAYTNDGTPLFVKQLKITGSVCTLLKDAIHPNLVQTLENTPVLIHGGPFANIAHGCNTIIATKMALKLADYTVTEAGFGADLGAEKFLHIKCAKAGIHPNAVVLVATIRALKYHGEALDFNQENIPALTKGLEHLKQHVENLKKFHIPIIVAVNRFITDTIEEEKLLLEYCEALEIPVQLCSVWADGGSGGIELAQEVINQIENSENQFSPLYDLHSPIKDKIKTIAKEIYRAKKIVYSSEAEETITRIEKLAKGLPVCISKTPLSFSDNPKLRGCPKDFTFTINSIRLATGAGYIVVMSGTVIDMPGLPRNPAMEHIDIDSSGKIHGLS